ncbi:hypothetical protein R1flu_005716 [Riccia fluitans]|uniref:RING-type domain-containing protein n=1 Tax=Riccia fluitans TaxID=41844 RepID=A0ABD1YXX6_9MARC
MKEKERLEIWYRFCTVPEPCQFLLFERNQSHHRDSVSSKYFGGPGRGRGREICSICLEPISVEGFLDQCFHKFCYHCILQWSEMVLSRPTGSNKTLQYLECPLCKTKYTSIIHDVSGTRFQRHYVLTSKAPGLLKSEAHICRQAVYSSNLGTAPPQPARLTDAGPKANRWVSCWVQRELQALMQEEDVDTVMHHVVGIVESFSKRSRGKVGSSRKQETKIDDSCWHETIAAAVRPFIFEYAERFATELESFLLSGLDITAYDKKCELAASAWEPDGEIAPPPVKEAFRSYDLYDEDLDDDFGHVYVRRESTQTESLLSEESSGTMKQRTRHEDADLREGKTSRKEDNEKDSLKNMIHGDSKLDRARSKHKSESRKKRKRSPSSSSSSRSSVRNKRSRRDKSRKKRRHAKRRGKKASEEQTRKSNKSRSRSRKRNYKSSDSSSESESSRSRSQSPVDRRSRRKTRKKDRPLAEKHVSRNVDSQNIKILKGEDDNRRTRDKRSRHHYSPSPSETDRPLQFSPENVAGRPQPSGRLRQWEDTYAANAVDGLYPDSPRVGFIPSGRGREGSAREDTYAANTAERSSPRSAEVGFNPRGRGRQGCAREDTHSAYAAERLSPRSPEVGFTPSHLSTSTSPRSPVGRYSWDAHECSRSPSTRAIDGEQTLRRKQRSEMSVKSSDIVEENANALELKLREQALANLLKHLGRSKSAQESTAAVNLEENSEVANQTNDIVVPSGSKDTKPQLPPRSKNLEDRNHGDVKEFQANGTNVGGAGKDRLPNMDLIRTDQNVKERTGYSESSRLADGKVIAGSGISNGDSGASVEGRGIVVELVVDNEPFDCGVSYRGSTPSSVTDGQMGKRKEKFMPEIEGQLIKGSCFWQDNQLAGRETTMQQVSRPQRGSSEAPYRQENLLGKEVLSTDGNKCRETEESVPARDHSAPKTGELRPDVQRSDREEEADIQSTGKDTQSYLNGVSRPEASQRGHIDGDEGGDSARFQQKSMSVTRGGESVEVSYKVYIPQRPAGARRRLQR